MKNQKLLKIKQTHSKKKYNLNKVNTKQIIDI